MIRADYVRLHSAHAPHLPTRVRRADTMSMPLTTYFTADAIRDLPDDGKRYETVHGELLMTPAPGGKHQPVLGDLHLVLGTYLAANGIRGVLLSPADISFGDDTLVQPDLFVADCAAFYRSGNWADVRTLYLVVEILSPSSVKTDRFVKRRLYQEQRIPEYWIVDIDQRQVEVWTPDALFPFIEREHLTWRHPALGDPCTVDLGKLFAVP
jgi:Uma2 family endonuclease